MMGAAWATVLSYACMALLGYLLSRNLYPIPFESGRLALVATAGGASYALSLLAPAALWPGLAREAGRGGGASRCCCGSPVSCAVRCSFDRARPSAAACQACCRNRQGCVRCAANRGGGLQLLVS
jgi:hypothetical protein